MYSYNTILNKLDRYVIILNKLFKISNHKKIILNIVQIIIQNITYLIYDNIVMIM